MLIETNIKFLIEKYLKEFDDECELSHLISDDPTDFPDIRIKPEI